MLQSVQRPLWLLCAVFPFVFFAYAHDMRWNPDSSTLESAYPLVPSETSRYIIGELEGAQADFFSLELPAGVPSLTYLLASQACPGFYPQLWLIAPELPAHTPPPFEIPQEFDALQLEYGWSLFRDLFLAARRGPGLEDFAGLDGYLAVYAPDAPGSYVLVWQGVDVASGTPQGWDALERFNRCSAENGSQ